jgi:hypothetical protein
MGHHSTDELKLKLAASVEALSEDDFHAAKLRWVDEVDLLAPLTMRAETKEDVSLPPTIASLDTVRPA